MKTRQKIRISRWGIIGTAGVIILLLVAGTLYAQSFGPRHGNQQGRGMGPCMSMGPGPGMGMGPGMGQGAPERLIGLQFMMQDPEIIELMKQVKMIEGINRLGLSKDQVTRIIDYGRLAQSTMNSEFSGLRDEIKAEINNQLNTAIAGKETDPEALRQFIHDTASGYDTDKVREKLEEILTNVMNLLTDEQKEILMSDMGRRGEGPGEGVRERVRERIQEFRQDNGCQGMGPQDGMGPDRCGPFQEWFQGLPEDEQNNLEQLFQDRIQNMRGEGVKIKIMMMLLSPEATEAMQIWLDAQQ